MRKLMFASAVAALAITPILAVTPAQAESSDVLGQVQRFLGGNNNSNDAQNAYEQGRRDQRREEQARRDRWRAEHAQNYDRYGQNRGYDYQHSRNYDSGAYNGGYSNNRY